MSRNLAFWVMVFTMGFMMTPSILRYGYRWSQKNLNGEAVYLALFPMWFGNLVLTLMAFPLLMWLVFGQLFEVPFIFDLI